MAIAYESKQDSFHQDELIEEACSLFKEKAERQASKTQWSLWTRNRLLQWKNTEERSKLSCFVSCAIQCCSQRSRHFSILAEMAKTFSAFWKKNRLFEKKSAFSTGLKKVIFNIVSHFTKQQTNKLKKVQVRVQALSFLTGSGLALVK